jgi:hypothetical protein
MGELTAMSLLQRLSGRETATSPVENTWVVVAFSP